MMDKGNINSREWQLLSAYLDQQLSEKEKLKVDQLLQTNPACRSALERLQHTRYLLKQLPIHRVPKNFTLTPQTIKRAVIPPFNAVLRYSSAVAALLLVFFLALDMFPLLRPPSQAVEMKAAEPEMMAEESMEFDATEAEPSAIIFWGGAPLVEGPYGKGSGMGYSIGGGEGGAEGYIPPGPVTVAPEEPAEIVLERGSTEGELVEEAASPTAAEEAAVEVAPSDALPESALVIDSGPILGVRPAEERGIIWDVLEVPSVPTVTEKGFPYRLIKIILAALVLLTAIPAWLLRGKTRRIH